MNSLLQPRTYFPTLAAALLASAASAQVPLSGNVFDGSGGPLLAGLVYFSTGSLTVPGGETLTIQPGAILKMSAGAIVTVNGVLDSLPGATSIITSIVDDSVGGDTNLDGPSSGAPGQWGGIRSRPGAIVDLDDTRIDYAGNSQWAPLFQEGGVTRVRNCTLANADSAGIDGNSLDFELVVEGTSIEGCTDFAMREVRIEQLPNLSGNVASGNAGGDVIHLATIGLARDTTIVADNLIGGVLSVTASATITAGTELALGADVAVKAWPAALITVAGQLTALGSAADPVVFTSIDDDSVKGDSRADGNTGVAPGAWSGLRVRPAALLQLEHSTVRYGGSSIWANVHHEGGTLILRNCISELCDGPGLDANSLDAPMTIENTRFENNTGWAMTEVRIERIPEFLLNTASGNGLGDAIRVTNVNLARDTSIGAANALNSTLEFAASATIPAATRLELGAGLTIKNGPGALWTVSGELAVAGTEVAPVTFTSTADETIGADVTSGATSGLPGDWSGVRSLVGGLVDADHLDVRFAGSSIWSAFYGQGGSLNLRRSSARDSAGPGLNLTDSLAPCEIVGCRFENNLGRAVDRVPLAVLEGFDANTAMGNLGGDYVGASATSINGAVQLGPRNLINSTAFIAASLTIAEGGSLTLDAGSVVKMGTGVLITVIGELVTRGTATAPVFFSDLDDDTLGGDSNANGPTFGSPGAWAGIRVIANSVDNGKVHLEQAWIRNGGASIWNNLQLIGTGHTLRAVRSEDCLRSGFELLNVNGVELVNCIANANGMNGFNLAGGTADLTHATAYGNGVGVASNATHSGGVRNSIAWGNAADLALGAGTGVVFSNAVPLPAGSGNLSVDPLFVDAAAGDFQLDLGSLLVDVASDAIALPVARDAADASRLTASSGLGGLRSDMGAYEQARWSLSMTGSQAIGEALSFEVSGEPGVAFLAYSPALFAFAVEPYGVLLIGPAPINQLSLLSVGTPLNLTLPQLPILVGLEYGIQALAFSAAAPLESQLTDLERLRFEAPLP